MTENQAILSERREHVRALVSEGKTLRQIIDETGSTEGAIRNDLRMLDIDISKVNGSRTDETNHRIGRIVTLHRAGRTVRQIADELGIPQSTAYSVLNRMLKEEQIISDPMADKHRHTAIPYVVAGYPDHMLESALGLRHGQGASLRETIAPMILAKRGTPEWLIPYMGAIMRTGASIGRISANTGIAPAIIERLARQAGVGDGAITGARTGEGMLVRR